MPKHGEVAQQWYTEVECHYKRYTGGRQGWRRDLEA